MKAQISRLVVYIIILIIAAILIIYLALTLWAPAGKIGEGISPSTGVTNWIKAL